MGIEVFINKSGQLRKSDDYKTLTSSVGWWNKLLVEDIDGDGDKDIIGGNLGLNYKFHASFEKPFHIYTKDFDYNGTEDIVLAKYYDDRQVPVRGKICMSQQMPHLTSAIPTFRDFASSGIGDIVGHELNNALHYEAREFRSGIFINNGGNNFKFLPFEPNVQRSPINSILYNDFDRDGIKDLLLAGNNYQSEIETTRADAGIGCFLKGKVDGDFEIVSNTSTGFVADGDIRNMIALNTMSGDAILVLNNNDQHDLYIVDLRVDL